MKTTKLYHEDTWTDEQFKAAVTCGAELYALVRGRNFLSALITSRSPMKAIHSAFRREAHFYTDDELRFTDLAKRGLSHLSEFDEMMGEYAECAMIAYRTALDVGIGMPREEAVNRALVGYQALFPGVNRNKLFGDKVAAATERLDVMLEVMYDVK